MSCLSIKVIMVNISTGVPLPSPSSIASIEELPVRAKREGFVDLGNISNMMRGFAKNLGRGINTMVQQGHNLGHRYVVFCYLMQLGEKWNNLENVKNSGNIKKNYICYTLIAWFILIFLKSFLLIIRFEFVHGYKMYVNI